MLEEKIYLERSNSIDLNFQRKSDGIWRNYSLTSVTRVILSEVNGKWSIDSSEDSGVFDWNVSGYPSKIKITAGSVEGLTAGTYNCYIVLYMPGYTNGYRWGDSFQIKVIE